MTKDKVKLWQMITAVLLVVFIAASTFAVVLTVKNAELKKEVSESEDEATTVVKDDTNKPTAPEKKYIPAGQGKIIEYGSYPQTKVLDKNTTPMLDMKALEEDNWVTLQNKMVYIDITTADGNKYRGVKANANATSIDWYMFEPLRWEIIEESTGLAVCVSAVDFQSAEKKSAMGKTENIYAWLNTDFSKTAFAKENTNDLTVNSNDYKVRLLELDEFKGASMKEGFYSDCKHTDYAKGLGSKAGINGEWWLKRTTFDTNHFEDAATISDSGVRPVINIKSFEKYIAK